MLNETVAAELVESQKEIPAEEEEEETNEVLIKITEGAIAVSNRSPSLVSNAGNRGVARPLPAVKKHQEASATQGRQHATTAMTSGTPAAAAADAAVFLAGKASTVGMTSLYWLFPGFR